MRCLHTGSTHATAELFGTNVDDSKQADQEVLNKPSQGLIDSLQHHMQLLK